MSIFVIAGKNDCPNCAHAIHVASYLNKHLPCFKYRAILKSENEWKVWLDRLNSENKWHLTKSPVIWKEISRRGGKAYEIGGLGEFWEYCYDYYGFQSRISKTDLSKIVADNLLIASKQGEQENKIISIIGALNPMLELLIFELQNSFQLKNNETILFRVYDEDLEDLDKETLLLETVNEIKLILKCGSQTISIVTTLMEVLDNCDLLVVIQDYSRQLNENVDTWLNRCMTAMLILAEDINIYAKRNLRVILNHHGPICFNASVLLEYCTKIRLANIVAVTADEGISVISIVANKIDELVENFGCPPVWGFSGILSYVDIGSTVIKGEVFRPFKRAMRSKPTSNLPKGQIEKELRLLSNLIKTEDDLYEEIEDRKHDEIKLLQRFPMLAKIRATASLVKLWFSDETTDEIISLGVCSNESFGFPSGVAFSQPVILNEKRIWEPLSNFPLTTKTTTKIQDILLQVADTLNTFDLGQKMKITN